MKGSILDPIFLMVIIGVFGLMLFVASLIVTNLSGTDLMNDEIKDTMDTTFSVLDQGTVFLFVGVILAVAMAYLSISVHPVFMLPFVIIIIITISISPIMSNIFMDTATSGDIITEANKYDNTVYVMAYMPWLIGVAVFIIFIAAFAKPGGGR